MKTFSIFVLDDDVMFCELLSLLAKHEVFTSKLPGYEVTFVTHSDMTRLEDAINYIRKAKPDLVLLDYMLGMSADSCLNSLDLLKRIIPYCSDIQMVSGLCMNDIRLKLTKKALFAIRIGFLSKPFGTNTLAHTVKESIQRKEHGQCC